MPLAVNAEAVLCKLYTHSRYYIISAERGLILAGVGVVIHEKVRHGGPETKSNILPPPVHVVWTVRMAI